MPAASHIEKEGTFTNTQRLVQWRDKALEPPGDARSELWFMHHLAKRVQAHYAGSRRERDWPIVNLKWDYPEHGDEREPDAEAVLKEINGYDVATGEPVPRLRAAARPTARPPAAAGSTPASSRTASTRRAGASPATSTRRGRLGLARVGVGVAGEPPDPLQPRLAPTREGKPWSERKRYVWWDEEQGKWAGYDVPDFPVDKRPTTAPATDAKGMDAIGGDRPVHHDGRRQGLAVRARRPARRADADALRAARVAGAEPALPEIGAQPGGAALEPARQPGQPRPATRATRSSPRPSGSPSTTPRAG